MSELPKGWVKANVGSLCDLINGKAFKPSDWSTNGLPIVRIQNLNKPDAPYNRFEGEVDSKFIIEDDQLLFAWSGTPGTSFGAHVWRGGKAVLNQHIFKVNFNCGYLDRDFIKIAINFKLEELIGKAHGGVGLRHVTKSKFEETEFPLPPLAEQKRIVAKLEALSARSTRARKDLARIDTLVTRYKQAILSKAFSGELSESNVAAWKERSVGDLLEDIRYGTSKKCDIDPTLTPVLRIPNVSNGTINLEDLKHADFDEKERAKLSLKSGNILIIRSNGSVDLVGRSAVVEQNTAGMLFAGYLIRIRLKLNEVDPMFLHLGLQSPSMRKHVEALAKSTSGVNNINSQQIQALNLRLPPLPEQKEIVRRIESAFDKIDRLAAEAKRALELTDKLDEAILAKAFRGELVPQDPNDEPASTLLARIKADRATAPKPKRGRGKKNG